MSSFLFFVISESCSVAPLIFSMYRNCCVDCKKGEGQLSNFSNQNCFVDCEKREGQLSNFSTTNQINVWFSFFVVSESCSVAPLILSMCRDSLLLIRVLVVVLKVLDIGS